VMVSIVKKSQRRNKRAGRTEGIIRVLLIILWAVVIVVLGFYSGLAYRHPSTGSQQTQNISRLWVHIWLCTPSLPLFGVLV
jgi:hypothetical protein